MDMSQIMTLLIGRGQSWVKEQRLAFRSRGQALPATALAQFLPFFEAPLLQEVRLVAVPALENPGFLEDYREDLSAQGIPLLDFSSMAAITFVDTILVVDSLLSNPAGGLIFHELVHAVQYGLLGADKFVELYILGWVNQGFNYAAIPLEMDAYELQNRFEADPAEPFSVSAEVSRSLELMLED
ncbi:MAG: hypothetical protein ACLPYB_12650 [Desulfobaccales bacterium]